MLNKMSKFIDQQYLTTDQYKDASNLNARILIHKRFSTNLYGWFNWVFDTLGRLPLVAYIRSMIRMADLSEDKLENLRKELSEIVERDDEIFVTKDSGLFKAMKQENL